MLQENIFTSYNEGLPYLHPTMRVFLGKDVVDGWGWSWGGGRWLCIVKKSKQWEITQRDIGLLELFYIHSITNSVMRNHLWVTFHHTFKNTCNVIAKAASIQCGRSSHIPNNVIPASHIPLPNKWLNTFQYHSNKLSKVINF